MMKKQIITRDQEERIRVWEYYHTGYPGKLLELHAKYSLSSKSKCLRSLTLDELARAIYVGYEVEEEFKVGNWIVTKTGYIGEIEYINSVEKWANVGYRKETERRGICLAKTFNIAEIERRVTPEEIAEEKERRWWNSHGRGVWELETEDILIRKEYGEIVLVKDVVWKPERILIVDEWFLKEEIKDDFKVICFKENRLDGDN